MRPEREKKESGSIRKRACGRKFKRWRIVGEFQKGSQCCRGWKESERIKDSGQEVSSGVEGKQRSKGQLNQRRRPAGIMEGALRQKGQREHLGREASRSPGKSENE